MAKTIVQNPKGQLLVNGLDQNNDSPIHLAAYRKQYDIFLLLASNNAFLDQPNAGSQDPIDALEGNVEIIKKVASMNLSDGNRKRIDKELAKLSGKANEPVAFDIKVPEKKIELCSMLASPTREASKTAGQKMFDQVMSNQKEYVKSGADARDKAIIERSRSPTMAESRVTRSKSQIKSNLNFEFDLLPPNEEFYPEDEIIITNLVPPNGFFYPLKSTAYDMI